MQLRPASWEIVPDLLAILKPHWPDTKTSYSILKGFNDHRLKFPELEVYFLTPEGSIDESATFAIYIPKHRHNLYIESLNPKIESFVSALATCGYINYSRPATFCCMHSRLWPIIDALCNRTDFQVLDDCEDYTYHISNEDAKALTLQIPEDVYLDGLTSNHAEIVNNKWPHGALSESLQEVLDYIAFRPSYGLFKKDTKDLVSWCLYLDYGGVGLLQVDENYKRRGYGSLVLIAMTKYLGELGIEPQATIVHNNLASIALFEKLGYKQGARSRWVQIINQSDS